MSHLATFQVGNYIIFRKRIGKGAFSNIYRGYHQYSKEMVAIKEISLETLNKYEKALRRETQIMKQLNHLNVVRLIESIVDEKTENVYLIMEYYERGDFSRFLKKRPLKEKYAVKYLKQIANGMEYLLSHKIIHRDLKPQNILVSDAGILKITDFGFARYFDNDILIQTICGSPMYMAPEIMKNKKYDFKSDLWSIGIIFFEMLTGRTPFHAKNIYELIRKIENDTIKIPQKFNLSLDCQDLILKLLEKNPTKRISWDDFFNHRLLKISDPFEHENRLMEISGLSVLPSVNNSVNHNSIFDSLNISSQIEENVIRNVKRKKDNSHIVTSNTNSDFHADTNLVGEINFNFNLEDEEDSTSSDEDVFYDSFDHPSQISNYLNNETNNLEIQSSQGFIKVEIEDNYFKSSLSLRQNIIKNNLPRSYVYIDIPPQKNRSNMSKSLLNYLNNSVSFLKESYTYFYNFNSI